MAYICCGLRFYVRLRVTRCPGWDDLFLCLSLVSLGQLEIHKDRGFLTIGLRL